MLEWHTNFIDNPSDLLKRALRFAMLKTKNVDHITCDIACDNNLAMYNGRNVCDDCWLMKWTY